MKVLTLVTVVFIGLITPAMAVALPLELQVRDGCDYRCQCDNRCASNCGVQGSLCNANYECICRNPPHHVQPPHLVQ
ncbi:unnamed protein product [Zymoseptoria tritici ST99CH_1E4]|uniref:Invertebrate defensins family profile domain-containing protein n=1 Tax=Zymoseptoria tritici ST99CH_1E4 TaxID=1276532 RepID=A0A2H1GN43_ZYMTR|nr:unnamed protein product [Zymoseptoria tritici ST99CH_1E4]